MSQTQLCLAFICEPLSVHLQIAAHVC